MSLSVPANTVDTGMVLFMQFWSVLQQVIPSDWSRLLSKACKGSAVRVALAAAGLLLTPSSRRLGTCE